MLPAGVEIRNELEKLRCSACGVIFTAGLPDAVGEEKYSAQARAVLAVSRYYLGMPDYRLQGYRAMLGVPVPDATQWDQIQAYEQNIRAHAAHSHPSWKTGDWSLCRETSSDDRQSW